jgi:hypothetical protein
VPPLDTKRMLRSRYFRVNSSIAFDRFLVFLSKVLGLPEPSPINSTTQDSFHSRHGGYLALYEQVEQLHGVFLPQIWNQYKCPELQQGRINNYSSTSGYNVLLAIYWLALASLIAQRAS